MSAESHVPSGVTVARADPDPSPEPLLRAVSEYLSENRAADLAKIKHAYEFAARSHAGQMRRSGDPYVSHPLAVAMLLAELRMDVDTVVAGLLHDVQEDCGVESDLIRKRFGREVAELVDGVTKLTRLDLDHIEGERALTMRKMFLAMARDIRVVIVKLADRLHNIRTVSALGPTQIQHVCEETLELYAPLAGRLGMWTWRWQLEDEAFRQYDPSEYAKIAGMLEMRRGQRETLVNEVVETLGQHLGDADLQAHLSGRAKHIYSIYRKMRRKGVDFEQIHDLIAVRVIVRTVEECYRALAVVHSNWRAIAGQFDDYISSPKSNRYQSLHTAVLGPGRQRFEVQIRTEQMHREAEYGVAAHWRYKEGRVNPESFDEKLAWIRQVLEWQDDLESAEPLIDMLKTDVFADQLFVFTPNGDVIDLPRGSTPLDFAYRIHTEVGHRCVGAQVNGRRVPLRYELSTGDTVEIQTNKASKGPSRDWLSIVATGSARNKIRQWFKHQTRAENEAHGRRLLERELVRIGHGPLAAVGEEILLKAARRLSYPDVPGLLMGVGYGAVTATQVVNRLGLETSAPTVLIPESAPSRAVAGGVAVGEIDNALTRLGACCGPLPGDAIVGYVTRGHGVTVHRAGCVNVVKSLDQGRLVEVRWKQADSRAFPARILAVAEDREGLLRDIATVVAEEGHNIESAEVLTDRRGTARVRIVVALTSIGELTRLLNRLHLVRNVTEVRREIGEQVANAPPHG